MQFQSKHAEYILNFKWKSTPHQHKTAHSYFKDVSDMNMEFKWQ